MKGGRFGPDVRFASLAVALALSGLALAGCADDARPEETDVAEPAATRDPAVPLPPPAEAPDAFPVPAVPNDPVQLPVPDPTGPGPLAWERTTFQLEARLVQGDAAVSPYLVIPEGSVHAPKEGGPYPVVVLMHGRHTTCRYADLVEQLGAPCPEAPPVSADVPSYAGYDYLAENLASHGYVVASLSANDVNDRDNDYGLATGDDYGATARARILLSFLDDLRSVESGAGPEPLRPLAGRLDLSRVGIMGHSRGGEGVARTAVLNAASAEPHALRAVFALAPTDFDRHLVLDVPLGVLLPYCDGDVSNLQGAWMYDDARTESEAGPLHQFLTLGANHNWYNTVWTGSDWSNRGDPHCDLDSETSGRDEPEAQRLHGLAVMAAFFRAYVGDEAEFLPLLVGEAPFAQPGVVVSYHPVTAHRLDLEGGAFDGFTDRSDCTGGDCPLARTYSVARQTYLAWDGAATWSVPLAGLDASAFERVSLRLAFDHEDEDAGRTPVTVTLEDAGGRTATVPLAGGVFHPPGESGAKATLNMAAAPLPATGVDLSTLAWLRVTFTGSGAAQAADLMFQDLR